jgi:hypothetical protein
VVSGRAIELAVAGELVSEGTFERMQRRIKTRQMTALRKGLSVRNRTSSHSQYTMRRSRYNAADRPSNLHAHPEPDSRMSYRHLQSRNNAGWLPCNRPAFILPENRSFFTIIGYFSYPSVQDDGTIAIEDGCSGVIVTRVSHDRAP